jgi:hypothetical protein
VSGDHHALDNDRYYVLLSVPRTSAINPCRTKVGFFRGPIERNPVLAGRMYYSCVRDRILLYGHRKAINIVARCVDSIAIGRVTSEVTLHRALIVLCRMVPVSDVSADRSTCPFFPPRFSTPVRVKNKNFYQSSNRSLTRCARDRECIYCAVTCECEPTITPCRGSN